MARRKDKELLFLAILSSSVMFASPHYQQCAVLGTFLLLKFFFVDVDPYIRVTMKETRVMLSQPSVVFLNLLVVA